MRILIFGGTGSIGSQSIEVITKNLKLEIVGISFFSNIKKAKEILNLHNNIFLFSPFKKELNNVESYEELLFKSRPDIIINAISGFAGLEITLLSLRNKINLILANKESIAIAGSFIMEIANKNKTKIIPLDSEITSIFSLIRNKKIENIQKIILTASGGKYFNDDLLLSKKITFDEAIKHPKWSMGYKISIDSSTMINKYFEIIEASYFFNYKIDVLQHSEAIVHSLIKFKDNSFHMYASYPDMKIAIQNVLMNFESNFSLIKKIDFNNLNLSFKKIDEKKWLPIKWAKNFLKNKNLAEPIIINSANDQLIDLFKQNKIYFQDIIIEINDALKKFNKFKINNIDDVYNLNTLVSNYIKGKYGFYL